MRNKEKEQVHTPGKGALFTRLAEAVPVLLFWLGLWSLAALLLRNPVLLPGPWELLPLLPGVLGDSSFLLSFVRSALQLLGAWFFTTLIALAWAMLAHRFPFLRRLTAPWMGLLRSIPFAALIVLLLLWIPLDVLPYCFVFFSVLPLLYSPLLRRLDEGNPDLEEVARVFGWTRRARFVGLFCPMLEEELYLLLPHSLGFAWKAGISGEIIARLPQSLGFRIYEAKILLSTGEILLMILFLLLCATLSVRLLQVLMDRFFLTRRRVPPSLSANKFHAERIGKEGGSLRFSDLLIAFREGPRWPAKRIHVQGEELWTGDLLVYRQPSGQGKTSLLRSLVGLQPVERGSLHVSGPVAMQFQEPRLLDWLDVWGNFAICGWSEERIDRAARALRRWGLEDLSKPVGTYSGGMRQKVALARCLFAPASLLLFDEPFQELDPASQERVLEDMKEVFKEKIVVLALHAGPQEFDRLSHREGSVKAEPGRD